jgi:hypothetical protein
MGSESWLLFKSPKEARRAEAFLAPTDGEIGIEDSYGCWLTWKGAKRLEIGTSAFSYGTGLVEFVQREICRRFDVRKIGADSVGWYSDSDFSHKEEFSAGANYPGYTSWAAWAKDYKPEWNYRLPKKKYHPPESFEEDYNTELNSIKEVETFVVNKFVELDRCAEST